jgi:hypothetical protein
LQITSLEKKNYVTKKTFTVILFVFATGLTLACSCLPLSTLEEFFLTEEPVHESPADDPVEPAATCEDRLGNLLSEAENTDAPGSGLAMEYTLVTYAVSGDTLTVVDYPAVPGNLESYQQDTALHQEMWDFIVDVVPAEYRRAVVYFVVFTDGPGGTLGAVEQTEDPDAWSLEIDARDAANFSDLATTLIHEVAHIFTLDTSQVATDYEVFNNPDDYYAYERGDAACDTYFMFEGCSYPNSYVNQFFERYWWNVYAEWLEINQEEDQVALENRLYEFYGQYADEFVSEYAVTSPEEDIAETFMYFVLAPQPAGETIAEEKILFFYEFPELVVLRDQMRLSLCPNVMP